MQKKHHNKEALSCHASLNDLVHSASPNRSIVYFSPLLAVIQLVFEETLYEVSESIAGLSSHLALLVCVTRRTNLEIEMPNRAVEVTISTENGTANG